MENLKGKRLLLLGGSLWKDTIKEFAQKHNIVLIATGNNRDAGIFDIADECYDVDSTNAELMKKLIIDHDIDGVYMGGSEPVIASACQYLNELDMPCYCTKEQWDYLQNKEKFKELCISYDLPVARKYNITSDDLLNDTIDVQFPVITKPSDGSGSNGFSVANNISELKEGYQKAKSISVSGTVIVEEFVKNDGIVVFYTFSDGIAYFSGIEDKYPIKYEEQGSYVAGMHIFESNKRQVFIDRFDLKLQKMFKSLDIREGSVWIEVFIDGENFYFNEAGYRYSGSVSIYPVDYFYSINQVASDIFYSLTGKSSLKNFDSIVKIENKKRYYCIYSIHLIPGTIKKINGLHEIANLGNVISVPVTMGLNHNVVSTGSVGQVFSFIHFVFDSVEECKNTIDFIHKNLVIYDQDGENMVAKLIDISRIKI